MKHALLFETDSWGCNMVCGNRREGSRKILREVEEQEKERILERQLDINSVPYV